ncbi:hypothetical protein [Pedobacter metabolipauper]|uniref:Lipoprotein n=1 Tax=Pedobacter metabolipauper TaxID=425513 RepID=A0A4R6SSI2_9SPHI|nr:hypothetical protein [Pedobacter metabolipauper]TDQ08257.1 hypothetical protein ATK78_2765 [Pedobacter metabolipauper]
MKNYIYPIVFLFLVSCGQSKESENREAVKKENIQDTPAVGTDPSSIAISPSSVEEIKQVYTATVNKLQSGSLDSTSFKYDCNGERRGTVTYFFDKGKLSIIKHAYSEYDHYSATDQYFVNDDELFFAHLKEVTWSFESGGAAEGATKDNITERRYYVVKEKSIHCLEKKYTIRSHSSDNPQPEQVQSKEVACKPASSLNVDFRKLIAFRTSSDHSCLKK